MREGYSGRFVSEWVCVSYLTNGYIPGLYVQSDTAYSFL